MLINPGKKRNYESELTRGRTVSETIGIEVSVVALVLISALGLHNLRKSQEIS